MMLITAATIGIIIKRTLLLSVGNSGIALAFPNPEIVT
jgi:hypothetical protein